MLIVLTGGARSGKSTLALERAGSLGRPVTFIATCPRIDGDAELEERIETHRSERPPGWTTIETEHDLAGALATVAADETAIVDCLTLWVNNLLVRGDDLSAIVSASAAALDVVATRPGATLVVTNEVGLGIVPADALSRSYRDALGRVNQDWVGAADRALFLVAGRALALHRPDELLG